MRNGRILVQTLNHRHDLRDAGFVVRAEQRGAVSHDEVVAEMLGQAFEHRRLHDHAELFVDDDGAAVVVLHDARVDVLAARLGGSVHVRDKSERGNGVRLGKVRRDRPHHIAMLVDARVLHAERAQLIDQQVRQIPLTRRRGDALAARLRLGVDLHVTQEAVFYALHSALLSSILEGARHAIPHGAPSKVINVHSPMPRRAAVARRTERTAHRPSAHAVSRTAPSGRGRLRGGYPRKGSRPPHAPAPPRAERASRNGNAPCTAGNATRAGTPSNRRWGWGCRPRARWGHAPPNGLVGGMADSNARV